VPLREGIASAASGRLDFAHVGWLSFLASAESRGAYTLLQTYVCMELGGVAGGPPLAAVRQFLLHMHGV